MRHKNQIYTSESLSQLSNYEGPLDNIFFNENLDADVNEEFSKSQGVFIQHISIQITEKGPT